MKHFIYVLTYFFSLTIFAQKEVIRIENDLKTSKDEISQSFSIVNESNNNLAIFLKDEQNTYGYLFNESLQQINSLKSENLSKKYKDFLGTSISDDNYNLFISNNKHKKFGVISYSFTNQKTSLKEIVLELSKESFLQSISHKNNFYILTATKNGLNLYSFKNDGKYDKTHFDLSDKKFLSKKNTICDFNFCLSNITGIPKNIEVQKIKNDNPNSIELTSNRIKLYVKNNVATLTIDNTLGFTQLIKIHLKELTYNIENFKKPYFVPISNFVKSNSFIYDDKILQIVASRKELSFTVKNLNTKKIIKEYNIKSTDSITFKNTPIIQDKNKGELDMSIDLFNSNHREFEKTTKFLRKITFQDIGISAFKIDGINQITIGGIKEIQAGMTPMGMPGFGGLNMGSFGSTNVFFNPTMFAYNGYNNTVSTYINCLFDENYNHVKGEIKENVFDKINNFKKDKEKFINAENLFNYKNNLLFGTCLGNSKTYLIMEYSK